jgi:hypothetical protein
MSKSVGVLERQVAFSMMNIGAENEELPEILKTTVKTPVPERGMCRAGEPAGPLTQKDPLGCDFRQLVQHTGQHLEVAPLENS